MATEMTLDLFEQQIMNYKKEDLQKKLDIAANILKLCEQRKAYRVPCVITKSSNLTGVPIETLVLINALDHKTKKFDEWFSEQNLLRHGYSFVYNKIRKQLVESYIKNREIPTGIKLKKEFEGYKKFFTTIQIPGTKSSIIVEKPETVIKRHRFLYTKMMYREANTNIVYIGKANIINLRGKFSYKEDCNETKSRLIIAASPTYGYINYIFCGGQTQAYLTNWIEEKLIPELPPESLIIFQENVLEGFASVHMPINSHSTKLDMMNWLTSNEIPHDPTMHKADLYKLINDYKTSSTSRFLTAEECLRAHGHITLVKPRCNLSNNYFDPFWEFLIHEQNNAVQPYSMLTSKHRMTQVTNLIVQITPVDYWKGLENILEEKERDIFREDLELEYIIDKLITMAKHEGMPKVGDKLYKYSDVYSKAEEEEIILLDDSVNKYLESILTPKCRKVPNKK